MVHQLYRDETPTDGATMRRALARTLLPALLLSPLATGAALPATASAQEAPRVRVIPRLGLLSPDSYLYEEFKNFAGDGFIEWTTGSLGRAALVGVGVEVAFDALGLTLRGEAARSFEGWLAANHGILIPRVYFQPPEIVNSWFDLPAAITFLGVQAVLPTRFSFRGVQPFVLGGYSGKWYTFGPSTRENRVEAIFPTDGWTASVDLGGGATFRLFGVTLEAQVRDNVNRYWGKTQHDLLLSGGVVWEVR